MEWSTHALSGMVAGYTVTGGDWRGAVVGGIAGVLPDLDEPKSKFGKLFFFIAIPLNSIFGHRTFTHSLLFSLLAGFFIYLFTDWWVGLSIGAGILAHIAGDMLTGKVKFFYPSAKSVGIAIRSFGFTLVDRITRLLLIILIGWVLVTKINLDL